MTEMMSTTKKPKKPKAPKLFPDELIDQLLAQVQNKDAESILGESGLAGQLKKQLAERMLAAELNYHLTTEARQGKGGNHRNGNSPKTVITPAGELDLDIPRDRLATFEPQLVAKYQRRLPGFDDQVISMYARGMSVREIQGHVRELYGLQVSPDLISTITDEVLADDDVVLAAEPAGRDGAARYYTGLSSLALGETDRGIAELDAFTAKYPNSPFWADAWMAKGRALAKVDRDAEAIAHHEQHLLLAIPQRECKHAAEARHAGFAPGFPGMDDDFGIGVGAEDVAERFQFGHQLLEIVDFAIEDDDHRAVFVEQGLLAAGQVDDRQPPVPQPHSGLQMQPPLVGTAMELGFVHRVQQVA